MADLDFELEIRARVGREYDVAVLRSPAGEARTTMRFPFDELALQVRLQALEIALLRSGGSRRRLATPEEQTVRDFGGELFDALLGGEVRTRFDISRNEAQRQGKALRIKLRFDSPAMASLPWEFLYDTRGGEYLALSTATPLVRYIELPDVIEPLAVTPPLRILALIASPKDLPPLDLERERLRIEQATSDLRQRGIVEIEWLANATWRDLQQALRRERWHIFHFVGHGGFDRNTDEGLIALLDDDGNTFRLPAIELGRLLGDHHPLRLALLNACEGARGSSHDLFSSTAATLVRRGTPAVVAMQYEITDRAAIEFSRSFYEAVADGLPVDGALSEARKAVSVAINNTLEWGTPVLFMRSADGVLFRIRRTKRQAKPPAERAITPIAVEPPRSTPASIENIVVDPPVTPVTDALADLPSDPASAQDEGDAADAASPPAEPAPHASAIELDAVLPEPTTLAQVEDAGPESGDGIDEKAPKSGSVIAPENPSDPIGSVPELTVTTEAGDPRPESDTASLPARRRTARTPRVLIVGAVVIVLASAGFWLPALIGAPASSPTALPTQPIAKSSESARPETTPPETTDTPTGIVAAWATEIGTLYGFGAPNGTTFTTKDGRAEVQDFVGGQRVYRIKATDKRAPLMGAILTNWDRRAPSSSVGYPISPEFKTADGYPYQEFENGILVCVKADLEFGGCAVFLTFPIFNAWTPHLADLGHPLNDVKVEPFRTTAKFEHGAIYDDGSGDAVVCVGEGTNLRVIEPASPPASAPGICASIK